MSQAPDPDEQMRRQEELNAHSASANAAVQTAAEHFQEKRENFLDELSDPEVDSEDFENLSQILGPDLSRAYILANKQPEDLRRDFFLNENEAERVLNEHNAGRLCKGPFLALAQGVNHRPDMVINGQLTADEKRKIREGLRVKTARQSLGVGARGLKAASEIITTTHVDHGDGDGDDDGRLKSLYNKVLS